MIVELGQKFRDKRDGEIITVVGPSPCTHHKDPGEWARCSGEKQQYSCLNVGGDGYTPIATNADDAPMAPYIDRLLAIVREHAAARSVQATWVCYKCGAHRSVSHECALGPASTCAAPNMTPGYSQDTFSRSAHLERGPSAVIVAKALEPWRPSIDEWGLLPDANR